MSYCSASESHTYIILWLSRYANPARQQKAKSPRKPLSLSGRRFYQIAVATVAEVHEPTGLTPLAFAVLIHLHDAPGTDQNTLSGRMALDRTSTGALVYRLEHRRLVERQVNGSDRRARVLRLAPRGLALHDKQRPKARAAQERLNGGANTGRASIARCNDGAGDRRQSTVRVSSPRKASCYPIAYATVPKCSAGPLFRNI